MGGGGFMKHAVDTNNQHRSKQKARRTKHELGAHESILKTQAKSLHFTIPDKAKLRTVLDEIRRKGQKRKKIFLLSIGIGFVLVGGLFYWLFSTFFSDLL